MTDCTNIKDTCGFGINLHIGEVLLIDKQAGRASIDFDNLTKFFNCARDKFTCIAGDVPEEIRAQIVKIFNTTTSTTQQIFYIAFGTIAITILLVTLIIFAGLYWRNEDYVILVTFLFALLIIIGGGLIAYFWITKVYNDARTIVDTNLNNISQVLTLIQMALLPSACCFGGVNCTQMEKCPCQCKLIG